MKLDYKKLFLISLGFFTVSIVWSVYNVAVPLYLKDIGLTGVFVGVVMSLDNVFAVLFQPIFGALSDRTATRYGRRMPYLLVGIPCAAIFFLLVPFARGSLVLLMGTIILLNFSMSIYRAPTVALMPDATPPALRSKANGIINLMGGIGTALALYSSGYLSTLNEFYSFAVGSLVLILVIIIMYIFIREPETIQAVSESKESKKDDEKSRVDTKGQNMSLIFLLLAIFFWFTAYNAIETFFSTYCKTVLGLDINISSYLLATVSVLFVAFAVPAGIIAGKAGRKRTILAGLLIFTITIVCLIFTRNITLLFVLMGVGGIGWALVIINSYPMVVQMADSGGIGKYTGFYYFFSMLASIISPIFFGFLKDKLGDNILFIYAAIGLIISFFFMMLVKHGEVEPEQKPGLEGIEQTIR